MSPFENALRETLAQPKYNQLTGRSIDFKEILADAARRIIAFLLDNLRIDLPEASGINTDIILYVFAILAVIVLLAAVGVTVRIIHRRRKNTGSDLSDIFEEIRHKHYTVEELLQLSRQRAEDENLREAVRFRFIAALMGLHDTQILRIEKSKTNAQLQAELSVAAPALSIPFSKTVEDFHWAWFGSKTIGAERYARFVEQTNLLLSQAKPCEERHVT